MTWVRRCRMVFISYLGFWDMVRMAGLMVLDELLDVFWDLFNRKFAV